MRILSDTDPMPFGKYKGRPMRDVPAEYLHWLWQQSSTENRNSPVQDYIRLNRAALEKEYPDGIWD